MLSKIKKREKSRTTINEFCDEADESTLFVVELFEIKTLLLISQSIDDFLEHRITADKTLEGILKDIQANTARIAEKDEENPINKEQRSDS